MISSSYSLIVFELPQVKTQFQPNKKYKIANPFLFFLIGGVSVIGRRDYFDPCCKGSRGLVTGDGAGLNWESQSCATRRTKEWVVSHDSLHYSPLSVFFWCFFRVWLVMIPCLAGHNPPSKCLDFVACATFFGGYMTLPHKVAQVCSLPGQSTIQNHIR